MRRLPSGSLFLAAALLCARAPATAQGLPHAERGAEQRPTPPPARQDGGAPPSDDAMRMGSPPGLPEGATQEAMWPAATAEGWSKPCLVEWQRSFDDALLVARARRTPILVAVNMDGEIASEHFAGVRYREPETAAQMNAYTCVIASVYRHTPRDYDEEGRRVECPRFGTVTCGEHIEAERELYDKYFDGKRVSPRHIVLSPEGTKTYDVYYSWDTATVFTTFKKGREGWPEPIEAIEPTQEDLVQSAEVEDREALEEAYATGDREARRALLMTLIERPAVDQVEVLRAAVFGLDLELARLARRALAQCHTEGALDLMAEALKAPLEAAERELLLGAVARLAETSPRARTLAALHSGLSLSSHLIDAQSLAALEEEYDATSNRGADTEARARAAAARPEEPGAALALGEALLARAQEATERRYGALLYADARSAARDAERLGAKGPRLDALVALTEAELGDPNTARARAVAAVEGGLLHPEGGDGATALTGASRARLLRLFAEARQRAIRDAFRAGKAWPPEWLSDVSAAYTSLAGDPLVDAQALGDYYDFLRWIGATPRADTLLDGALVRFPDSPDLHERLRARLLWEGGPERLEKGYAERLAREEAAGNTGSQLTWFAGYASLVAAEHHRRRGELDAAVASYERASASFARNAELFPGGRDTCLHFMALGRAGVARVALERGELDAALAALLSAFELRPDSAATPDGLNLTPVATAKMLMARLSEAGDEARAARVQAALDALDPRLLEPPASERSDAIGAGPRERRGGRRGGELVDFEAPDLSPGFKPAENAGTGTPAAWRIEGAAGQRALIVESNNGGATYNLLVREGSVGPDVALSVRLQAWKGEEDQGGGLLWRAKDADNYYVARWNPLEENLRVYAVVGGKRTAPFESAAVAADPGAWHELSVTMQGAKIAVRFDGREVIAVEDRTFAEAGAVGLWTKADASTRFDDLRIAPEPR